MFLDAHISVMGYFPEEQSERISVFQSEDFSEFNIPDFIVQINIQSHINKYKIRTFDDPGCLFQFSVR